MVIAVRAHCNPLDTVGIRVLDNTMDTGNLTNDGSCNSQCLLMYHKQGHLLVEQDFVGYMKHVVNIGLS